MLKYACFILAIVFTLTLFAKESQIITSITPNQSIANVNTLVTFTGKITSGKDIPSDTLVRYEEFINGILTRHGYTTLDTEIVLEHKMTTPGWYFVKLKMFDKNPNFPQKSCCCLLMKATTLEVPPQVGEGAECTRGG